MNNYTYEVKEDTDTRTNEKIYLVRIRETLSRDEYIAVNKYMKSLGGYYSRFKRAFLFRDNPTEKTTYNHNRIKRRENRVKTSRNNGSKRGTP